MKIEFDLEKSEKNVKERGLPFELVSDFDWETATYYVDDRKEYGELRVAAFGYIGERLYGLCFTPRKHGIVRVISLRKANLREVKRYEEESQKTDY